MPRTIEFDPEVALSDAMHLFWRQGYHRTSMRDLTEATRLKPGSLYGTFGNKRSLFMAALEHYARELAEAAEAVLGQSDVAPLARIENFLDGVIRYVDTEVGERGCLLVNTLLEVPPEDESIARCAARGLEQVETRVAEVLQEAMEAGEMASDRDPAAEARLLMVGIFGLRVYSRIRPEPEVLRTVVESLLRPLRRPAH